MKPLPSATSKPPFKALTGPGAQRGIATILVILMISLGMTVAAIGIVYSLRGTQELQVAAHARTHSQAAAWAGVEVFRKYLYGLTSDPAALAALTGELDISINNVASDLTAEIVNVSAPAGTTASDTFDITVNIRSEDSAAKSSSVVQVMYRIAPYACTGDGNLNATLDFHRDLSMGGEITVLTDPGNPSKFLVDGSFSAASISVSGISSLSATGDVSLGSAAYIPEVRANGNILLTGSASVGSAKAVGTLTLDVGSSGRVISEAYINGEVILAGGNSGAINSLADVSITNGSATSITTSGSVTVDNKQVGDVYAQGDVALKGNNPSVVNVFSESKVICSSGSGWSNFTSILAADTTNCPSPALGGQTVTVPVMNAVQPFSMEPVKVDAWALKGEANYIFEYDGQLKVTVQQVNSIADGAYYIGDVGGMKDYLCETVDGSGQCVGANDPIAKICNGYSDYNSCFDYDPSSDTWDFGGLNMAPGVAWVKGNLDLGNGKYYNTFVATGNLTTANSHKTYSINFAGFDAICNNDYPVNKTAHFQGLYPENFCDMDNGVLINPSIGNIALLAGGYDPNLGGAYAGGDINLGASSEIFGTVMAGNYLFSGGDTDIHGYMTAAALGSAQSGLSNSLGGSTTVNLQNLPSTYDPTLIPNMDTSVGSCGVPNTEVAKAFWSRYL